VQTRKLESSDRCPPRFGSERIRFEGPPSAGLQSLTGPVDKSPLAVIVEFVGKTVVTVYQRTQVVADRQPVAVRRFVCAPVLSWGDTATQSNAEAVQLRGCVWDVCAHTSHTCLMSGTEPVPTGGVS